MPGLLGVSCDAARGLLGLARGASVPLHLRHDEATEIRMRLRRPSSTVEPPHRKREVLVQIQRAALECSPEQHPQVPEERNVSEPTQKELWTVVDAKGRAWDVLDTKGYAAKEAQKLNRLRDTRDSGPFSVHRYVLAPNTEPLAEPEKP